MNDNLFKKIFEFERKSNEIYAGNIAYQDLLKINQATEEEVVQINGFEVKDNKIWFSKKQGVDFKEIPKEETIEYIDRTSIKTVDAQKDGLRIDLQNCVICPVEMLAEFNSAETGLDAILVLQHASEEFSVNTIPRLLNELVERNDGRYNFTIEDSYLTMEKRSQEQDNVVRMFFAVSVILLMIVMIGMIGTLLILFQKRKKEIAITIAFGATMRRNLLEMFGEVVIVFLCGGILGLLLADIICGYNLNVIDISFYPICIHLLQEFSVADNIALPLGYAGIGAKQREKTAKELLEKMGLVEKAARRPFQLSGGEQQRVAIARAISNQPEVLLADEPTGSLDEENGIRILEMLKKLNEQGLTIIMVTHDPKVSEYADRVIRITDGKI